MTKHYHSIGIKLSASIYGDVSKKTNKRGVAQENIFMPSLTTNTDNLAIIYAMIYLADTSTFEAVSCRKVESSRLVLVRSDTH